MRKIKHRVGVVRCSLERAPQTRLRLLSDLARLAGPKDCTKLRRTSDQRASPHADIYTARSPTNRAGGENATTPAGSRPVDRISWNPSARQGVLQVRYRAVRRKEKLLCQYKK